MSLSVDGVWKTGVWATTVWADGVWREGASATSGFGTNMGMGMDETPRVKMAFSMVDIDRDYEGP